MIKWDDLLTYETFYLLEELIQYKSGIQRTSTGPTLSNLLSIWAISMCPVTISGFISNIKNNTWCPKILNVNSKKNQWVLTYTICLSGKSSLSIRNMVSTNSMPQTIVAVVFFYIKDI